MRRCSPFVLLTMTNATHALAQGATSHLAAGNRLLATRNAGGALPAYELALTADLTDYDALRKASRTATQRRKM